MLNLSLSHLHRPADPAVTQPWLLVLMHGVGSNEQDLFGLAAHVPAHFHVLSLRAPNVMGPGAYAWFQFSVTAAGRVINEAQEVASRTQVAQVVAAAAQQLGVPAERVVVGGFSQGGIMSLSLLLTQPALLQATMVMHSRLLEQVLPLIAPAAALQGKHLWVSHGTVDAVIPLAHAHAIRSAVQELPITLRYSEFHNAHEITRDELAQAMQWLQALSQPQD
ncbi:phospholipase/carboxylesterase [Polaromonas sp. OV174]|uniref:alpha/beta hydrolase n=1 Tax=Polaromonas sp. OV174 TaxID=1855300 RepID=UPI0008F13430|nr:dienelactone hydrolase family protein [Polaromonas sp. OV174]SFC12641.1 phospholipase/carboxylesterase [Polaromonas sp. OV174]